MARAQSSPRHRLAPPCPRCLALAQQRVLRIEHVQPLPEGTLAPLSRARAADGTFPPCCFDCAAADALVAFMGIDFDAARIAVGNDRQEQLRFPAAKAGLVKAGLMRTSVEGDLDRHLAWLDAHGHFGLEGEGSIR